MFRCFLGCCRFVRRMMHGPLSSLSPGWGSERRYTFGVICFFFFLFIRGPASYHSVVCCARLREQRYSGELGGTTVSRAGPEHFIPCRSLVQQIRDTGSWSAHQSLSTYRHIMRPLAAGRSQICPRGWYKRLCFGSEMRKRALVSEF
jgi:hypothetical protein